MEFEARELSNELKDKGNAAYKLGQFEVLNLNLIICEIPDIFAILYSKR